MKPDGYALITGASRGLGMAFARALAGRHYNVVLVARSPEPLHAFASELRRSTRASVIDIQVDLSTPGAGQILAEQLSSGDVPIDLLVNNAGLVSAENSATSLFFGNSKCFASTTKPSLNSLTASFRECWSGGKKASSISPQLPAFSPFPLRAPTPQPRHS